MKFPPPPIVLAFACCLAALLPAGCKKRSAVSNAATSAPSATTPAASTMPITGPITVEFDGEPQAFPPAELRVRPAGAGIVATLATVDAPDASGGANALHLEMTFPDLANSSELDGAEWRYREPDETDNRDAAEPPEAIELRHRQAVLEPAEATAVIHLDADGRAVVELSGTFKLFDPPEAGTPTRTPWVTAKVQATVRTAQ